MRNSNPFNQRPSQPRQPVATPPAAPAVPDWHWRAVRICLRHVLEKGRMPSAALLAQRASITPLQADDYLAMVRPPPPMQVPGGHG